MYLYFRYEEKKKSEGHFNNIVKHYNQASYGGEEQKSNEVNRFSVQAEDCIADAMTQAAAAFEVYVLRLHSASL